MRVSAAVKDKSMSSTLVMKFGGSSVGTTTALTQVLSIVLHEAKRRERLIVVASALDGVTDLLIEAAHLAQVNNGRGYRRIAAQLRTRHMNLVEKLPFGTAERAALQEDLDRLLFEMLNIYQSIAEKTPDTLSPQLLDSVIGTGEKLSARIIAAQIRQSGLRGVAIDAHDLMITNDTFGNAVPDLELTRRRVTESLLPMLDRQIIPVITGFIGGTKDGRPTTLGRGGSDFTASLLAVTAGANELWVWTDVDGIMTADPNDIPQAKSISELSYDEMGELAYFGAKVLHQRMVAPLKEHGIPLCIKNVYKPQQIGTWISAKPIAHQHIKAVTRIQAILLTAESSGMVSQVSQLVDEAMFATIGVHADVMIASQASRRSQLCYIIPTSAGPDVGRLVEMAVNARLTQNPLEHTWAVQQASVITAVGADLNSSTGVIANVLHALDGLRILAVAQNPVWCAVSIVVEPRDSDMVLQRLHALTL